MCTLLLRVSRTRGLVAALAVALTLVLAGGCGAGAGGRGAASGPPAPAAAPPPKAAAAAAGGAASGLPAPAAAPPPKAAVAAAGGAASGPPAPAAAPPPKATPAAAAAGCAPVPWNADETTGETTYRGKLEHHAETIPNGQVEQVYVIVLDRPACFEVAGRWEKEATEIHVIGADSAMDARLQALIGRHVVATGEGFAQITAHHHRLIVVHVTQLSAK